MQQRPKLSQGLQYCRGLRLWVNRVNLPVEELGVTPNGMGGSLAELVTLVQSRS